MPVATRAIIFLHGSCDSGKGIASSLREVSNGDFEKLLAKAGIAVIYPDSPVIKNGVGNNSDQAVWFDQTDMSFLAPEDGRGIAKSVALIDREIDKLVSRGLAPSNIAVGGFSMGGCLALHVAYGKGRYSGKLGAAACLSSFLADDSCVYSSVEKRCKRRQGSFLQTLGSWLCCKNNEMSNAGPSGCLDPTPLFMAHGCSDTLVEPAWARETRDRLEAAGVRAPSSLPLVAGMEHNIAPAELSDLADFFVSNLTAERGDTAS
eukprot:TRINITY_DN2465_c0_g1_i1.p1 TRINITY_DN2465_c0_g1~~TRINITY_DN2465_c0_g1_i1.p1  ORF type:complete len:262 (+),score=45.42 TRINITY_DN2465_c0_g1_i1:52-837(+)